jgi:DNA-binding PadR family transcriptional regulator
MRFQATDDFETRAIKSFADILILKYIKGHPFSTAYNILRYFHEEFEVLFSPGTVYNAIHLLEQKGLIEGSSEGAGIYLLTKKGSDELAISLKARSKIQKLVCLILSDD